MNSKKIVDTLCNMNLFANNCHVKVVDHLLIDFRECNL